jgi:hypothetical protein
MHSLFLSFDLIQYISEVQESSRHQSSSLYSEMSNPSNVVKIRADWASNSLTSTFSITPTVTTILAHLRGRRIINTLIFDNQIKTKKRSFASSRRLCFTPNSPLPKKDVFFTDCDEARNRKSRKHRSKWNRTWVTFYLDVESQGRENNCCRCSFYKHQHS